MALEDTDVFTRLERFYDSVPRDAAVTEDIGGFVLFIREGAGWPYYARPRLGGETPSAADVTAVRVRQRELGAPEAFEWVHETTPDLLAVARSAGLDVLLAPLMVLDRAALVPDLPIPGATIRFLDPASPAFAADIAASRAVGRLGFGAPASATGATPATDRAGALVVEPAGPAQRDAVPAPAADAVADLVRRHASGRFLSAVVESPGDGILASGSVQRVGGVAEVVGVATLPSARRRGYASQLTASLARRALEQGDDLVFLSAGDDDVARLYSKVGFRRIGTACIGSPAVAPL
ncbi:GNAT family N-acetyltransferase [Actinoplanes sp. NPDC049548]|uniref:GNAT family N-acetyltransferase n=1 Tax=Actinoplanes sp. NPDC049548 TaxID=3155152 RepID=UPI00341FC0E1